MNLEKTPHFPILPRKILNYDEWINLPYYDPSFGLPHAEVAIKAGRPPLCWACPLCAGGTTTVSKIVEHINTKHLIHLPYQCSLCNSRFRTALERINHLDLVHCPSKCKSESSDEPGEILESAAVQSANEVSDADSIDVNDHGLVRLSWRGSGAVKPSTEDSFGDNYAFVKYIRGKHDTHGLRARLILVERKRDKKLLVAKVHGLKNLHNEYFMLRLVNNKCSKIVKDEDYLVGAMGNKNTTRLMMEWFPDGSLQHALNELDYADEFMKEHEVWKLALDISHALKFLQTGKCEINSSSEEWRPIVHYDLKPENIMRNDRGWKLIDFGLAQLLNATGPNMNFGRHSGGTMWYIAPEWPLIIGTKADVWALGVIIHEICTGEKPRDQRDYSTKETLEMEFQEWASLPVKCHNINQSGPFTNNYYKPATRQKKHTYSWLLYHLMRWMLQSDPNHRPTSEDVERAFQFHYGELARRCNLSGRSFKSELGKYSGELYDLIQADKRHGEAQLFQIHI